MYNVEFCKLVLFVKTTFLEKSTTFLLIYGQKLELIKILKVLKVVFYHNLHVILTKVWGWGFWGLGLGFRVWLGIALFSSSSLISSTFLTYLFLPPISWPLYRAWSSPNYELFPWIICNGCGMPAGNAYPSGHLVPSPFWGLAYAPMVETSFSRTCSVFFSIFYLEYLSVLSLGCLLAWSFNSFCGVDFVVTLPFLTFLLV